MRYLIFLLLALIEYILFSICTFNLNYLKEYISIKYSSFEFSNIESKPYGLNVLIRLLFPAMFIVIISGIFYNIGKQDLINQIYLITIFFYLIRWFNIVFILRRKELQNWKFELLICFIGIVINLLLYKFFITKTSKIFVPLNEIRNGIWISIITFIFVLIKNIIYDFAYIDIYGEEKRKENYILKKYENFRNKYEDIITTENKELKMITYSIMIYENFNRPKSMRILEYIKLLFKGSATLGVMQVHSRNLISDKISVKRGYEIIQQNYNKFEDIKKEQLNDPSYDGISSTTNVLDETIYAYNNNQKYVNEVSYIFNLLNNHF